MSTEVLETPQAAPDLDSGDPADTVHYEMCCFPLVAYCGTDLTGDFRVPEEAPATCHVCIDLVQSGLTCQQIRVA